VSFVGCALTIIRQVLVSRGSPVEIEHLGERFISYARRVRTFEINSRAIPKVNGDPDRKIKRQVSPSVVSLWARLGSMAIFPQLQRLMAISPAFGDPWDAQVILDLIDKRPGLTDISFMSWPFGSSFCGQSLHVSTEITGSLWIRSVFHAGNNTGPYRAVLGALLSSSPRLLQLYVDHCVGIDEMMQLTRLSELTHLTMSSPSPPFPLPPLPTGAFSKLRELKLMEYGARPMLMELFLAMHPNVQLVDLAYSVQSTGQPRTSQSRFLDVDRFFAHASRWTSLQAIEFQSSGFQIAQDSPTVEQSRALFRRMHTLRNLGRLKFTSNVHLQITPDIFESLLSSCSSLYEWSMLSNDRRSTAVDPISFHELYRLIRDRHMKIVPFRLQCTTLPDLAEAHDLKPLSLTSLNVRGIEDPTALGKVIATICPDLVLIETERRSDDPASYRDKELALVANVVLRGMRSAKNEVLVTES
jgi:hypothetical protein